LNVFIARKKQLSSAWGLIAQPLPFFSHPVNRSCFLHSAPSPLNFFSLRFSGDPHFFDQVWLSSFPPPFFYLSPCSSHQCWSPRPPPSAQSAFDLGVATVSAACMAPHPRCFRDVLQTHDNWFSDPLLSLIFYHESPFPLLFVSPFDGRQRVLVAFCSLNPPHLLFLLSSCTSFFFAFPIVFPLLFSLGFTSSIVSPTPPLTRGTPRSLLLLCFYFTQAPWRGGLNPPCARRPSIFPLARPSPFATPPLSSLNRFPSGALMEKGSFHQSVFFRSSVKSPPSLRLVLLLPLHALPPPFLFLTFGFNLVEIRPLRLALSWCRASWNQLLPYQSIFCLLSVPQIYLRGSFPPRDPVGFFLFFSSTQVARIASFCDPSGSRYFLPPLLPFRGRLSLS